MNGDWRDYQEEAAAFFRTLGLSAETNVRLKGTRTTHDIDVVIKSVHAGFDVTWLVECKHWKDPITKLHVLGLRQIVIDLGADRGILLSESGFQSGAIEAAKLTNVRLTSLAALEESAKHDIFAMRLRDLFNRVETCNERYWEISKEDRIEMGLRPDIGRVGYSGTQVIDYCRELLSQSMRDRYPIVYDGLPVLAYPDLQQEFSGPEQVVPVLDKLIGELEGRLALVTRR